MWQDQLFFWGAVALNVCFIPALITKHKPPRLTAAVFALVIASWAFGFWTLGLYWSMIINIVGTIMWGVSFVQKREQ